jgi:hypothetical protein
MKRAGIWALILMSLVACRGAVFMPPAPPTAEAARAYLDELVALVQDGRVQSICTLGAGTCPHTLRQADLTAVPNTPPRLIGTRAIPPTDLGDGMWDVGGRLLMLCGIDGHDRPYYTELLVFQDGDRLIATDPLYWTGGQLVENGQPVPPPSVASPC